MDKPQPTTSDTEEASNVSDNTFNSLSKIIEESGLLDRPQYQFSFIQRGSLYRDENNRGVADIPWKYLYQANYKYLWEAKAVAKVIQQNLLAKERESKIEDWFEIQISNDLMQEEYYWDITFADMNFEKTDFDE